MQTLIVFTICLLIACIVALLWLRKYIIDNYAPKFQPRTGWEYLGKVPLPKGAKPFSEYYGQYNLNAKMNIDVCDGKYRYIPVSELVKDSKWCGCGILTPRCKDTKDCKYKK